MICKRSWHRKVQQTLLGRFNKRYYTEGRPPRFLHTYFAAAAIRASLRVLIGFSPRFLEAGFFPLKTSGPTWEKIGHTSHGT